MKKDLSRRSLPDDPTSPLEGLASAWRLPSIRRCAPASEGGFTLLELIVAMMIFSIVIAAAYALFDAGRSISSRAEYRAELFQTGRAALQTIEDDLRGAILSGSVFDTGLIAKNIGKPDAPLDEIEIVAVNVHTASEPVGWIRGEYVEDEADKRIDLSKVTYWIEQDVRRPAHGLVRERPRVLTPTQVYVRRDEDVEEVARDVVGLDLRYFDAEWKETWDSIQLRKLPQAIEVTVFVRGEWRGEEVLEKFTNRFYLPVGAEIPERAP